MFVCACDTPHQRTSGVLPTAALRGRCLKRSTPAFLRTAPTAQSGSRCHENG